MCAFPVEAHVAHTAPLMQTCKVSFGFNVAGISTISTSGVATVDSTTMVSFLDLPAELRNKIYSYAADWNDINAKMDEYCTRIEDLKGQTSPPPNPRMPLPPALWTSELPELTTPTILLLNRQIYGEAMAVVEKKHLIIWCPPPSYMRKCEGCETGLEYFITRSSLAKIGKIEFQISDEEVAEHGYRGWNAFLAVGLWEWGVNCPLAIRRPEPFVPRISLGVPQPANPRPVPHTILISLGAGKLPYWRYARDIYDKVRGDVNKQIVAANEPVDAR